MPIHLHLDLPTSSNLVPPFPPHTFPAHSLYHSKCLKDPQTKNSYTSALAKKVAKSYPPLVDSPHNFMVAIYLRNLSLTLQMPQSSKFFNTQHM